MSRLRECALALRKAATSPRRIPNVQRVPSRSMSQAVAPSREDVAAGPSSRAPRNYAAQDQKLAQHLNKLFPPLKFPPELASRILTHASHPDAARRHNARLSFLGRRVLQSYLLMFVHSLPAVAKEQDYEKIMERTLNSYVLGEHVAPHWALGKVLKWRPMNVGVMSVPLGPDVETPSPLVGLGGENARSVGLYKVYGTTVEAVTGGVFHQYGGSVAHRLFHTRVLPNLLLPGAHGLHTAFHDHARKICEDMGGVNGSLVR